MFDWFFVWRKLYKLRKEKLVRFLRTEVFNEDE